MNGWESLAAGGLVSLLAAEFSDLGPWLARRVIKLSARLLLDRQLAGQYDKEWLAGIDGTPGKLTPLARAAGVLVITVPVLNYRYFDDWWACTIWLPIAAWNLQLQLKWPRSLTWGKGPDVRSMRKSYNHTLWAVCHVLCSGTADERAEALDALKSLVSDPPPWTFRRSPEGCGET